MLFSIFNNQRYHLLRYKLSHLQEMMSAGRAAMYHLGAICGFTPWGDEGVGQFDVVVSEPEVLVPPLTNE